MNEDINSQLNVWCLNLNTGDKYSGGKWKEYCSVVPTPAGSRAGSVINSPKRIITFKEGSVVGVLVNTKHGKVHFFKDGKDLGEAFSHEALTKGQLFPCL